MPGAESPNAQFSLALQHEDIGPGDVADPNDESGVHYSAPSFQTTFKRAIAG
jgi:hypothetical protein